MTIAQLIIVAVAAWLGSSLLIGFVAGKCIAAGNRKAVDVPDKLERPTPRSCNVRMLDVIHEDDKAFKCN